MLRVRLLGGFDLIHDGVAVSLAESARAQSLLAYLILHRHAPQSRQQLAFLLWPDSNEAQARTNLRHLLHNVRHALPDPDRLIEVSGHALRWRPDAPVWIDVVAFEDALARAGREGGEAALPEAVELYRGDLLTGCWDEWLLTAREALRQRYLAALDRLVRMLEGRGELTAAIGYAQQLVREDPLQEEPYRVLMRLHAAAGDRGRAVRAYHACVTALERELGVEPSGATVRAYEALVAADEGAAPAPRADRLAGPVLVGRAAESERLAACWSDARRGRAQLVLVTGEPGVGKTRLVDELADACAHQGALVAKGRAYAAEGTFAYGLLIAWLRSEALAAALARSSPADAAELAHLLPELAAAAPPTRAQPASEQRRRLFDAAARAMLATGQPVVLVADDLHWADLESIQFVHFLVRSTAARLLVAATARSEDLSALGVLRAGLQSLDRLAELEIGRLSAEETVALAERLAGRALAPEVARQLHDRTEGNPLFIVETLRAGWDGSPDQALAPRLQAVIRARLEQLSPAARELVGLAATIGREFASDVIAAAGDADPDTAVTALDELWRRGILREQGADAYDFSHDRIREVAYADLGPARRRRHHERVAQALLAVHGPEGAGVQAQLAAHFEQAGRSDAAVDWYVRAADAARMVHAYGEAVRLLERAAALLGRLPRTAARRAEIQSAIPALIAVLDGYTSPRLIAAQDRALGAVREAGGPPDAPLVLSLALTSLCRGDFAAGRRHAADLVARGERDTDEPTIVEGRYLLGVSAFWKGELASARGHLEAALARYRAEHRPVYLARYGHDSDVVCRGRLANTLLLVGETDAARRASEETLELARRIDHPFTSGLALVFAALLAIELGDRTELAELTGQLAALPQEYQPLPSLVVRDGLLGLDAALGGDLPGGMARIERGFERVGEVDPAPGSRAFLHRIAVAACVSAGDPATALAAADRALAESGQVRLWQAELLRVRAEALAAGGASAAEVDAELARALAVAREQGAALLALRVAVSVGRRGDRDLVRAALAGIREPTGLVEVRDAQELLAAT